MYNARGVVTRVSGVPLPPALYKQSITLCNLDMKKQALLLPIQAERRYQVIQLWIKIIFHTNSGGILLKREDYSLSK